MYTKKVTKDMENLEIAQYEEYAMKLESLGVLQILTVSRECISRNNKDSHLGWYEKQYCFEMS